MCRGNTFLVLLGILVLASMAIPQQAQGGDYFATTLYQANIDISSVETAEGVINTPSEQTSATSETESVLNFLDTGPDGHFGADNPFPGMTIGEGLSNYVLQATGTITVTAAQAGYYTFGVNSDDGFSLTITGAYFTKLTNATNASGSNTVEYDTYGGTPDTLGTTYLAAGIYPVNLVYFQGAGNAELEFYAAKESASTGASPSTRTRFLWAILWPPPPMAASAPPQPLLPSQAAYRNHRPRYS